MVSSQSPKQIYNPHVAIGVLKMEKTKTQLQLIEEGMDLFSVVNFPSTVTQKQMYDTFVKRVYAEGELSGMEKAKQILLANQ